jgi:type II secretory ATPase GspE/PulE/Tfp pilus assembly ATPase PilB-like protein
MNTPSPTAPGALTSACKAALEAELARGADISIIKVVEALVERAQELNASDIHIDPAHERLRIRFRIDGVLQDIDAFPKTIHQEVISRIKVLASLRTDEHQCAQDGRFRHSLPSGKFVDIRVSIVPTYHGENAVLRLLTDHSEDFTLAMLGFSALDQEKIQTAMKRTSGMILSTGPTGSGKTTTLYTLIKLLSKPEVSIITIEDPIEYSIDSIEQIQVNAKTGLSFANGLRSVLRQDPDIIMVGEIRDAETATIAVNTALTGHLLLSTLHTNDATTTLPRLSDMGIDPYLVASTMNIAIGQRLVRKNCTACRKESPISEAAMKSLSALTLKAPFVQGEPVYKGTGCDACIGSGYRGRLCINEVLVATPAIREAILRKESADEIKRIAVAEGMTTMLDDGALKVRAGETTIEEVLRVIHE